MTVHQIRSLITVFTLTLGACSNIPDDNLDTTGVGPDATVSVNPDTVAPDAVTADITPPVITLFGTDPERTTQGKQYVSMAGTAFDDVDGVLDVSVTTTVDTNTIGTYWVKYSASDRAGNTTTIERTLHVVGEYFISTWKTDNFGFSADNKIVIQAVGSGHNYEIDWGDGHVETGVTGLVSHDYDVVGTYTIKIRGDFPHFRAGGDAKKLLSIEQWGAIPWRSMNETLANTELNNQVIDIPDLSLVQDMSGMFRDSNFDQPIGGWDVSAVTDMSHMFRNGVFNQEIGDWDVAAVTDMEFMFNDSNFNQDIGRWDVSSVTTMKAMFTDTLFNQDIGAWQVSAVENMRVMFARDSEFNQNLSRWDVSAVTEMGFMFSRATNFNQDLSRWEVSNVEVMTAMLSDAGLSIENYSALLKTWPTLPLRSNVAFGAARTKYSADAQAGRDILTGTFNWSVSDGGRAPQ